MAPGYRLPRHAHDCFRLEVIMQGSMDVGDGRILKTGAVMMSEPLTLYGPHIAGAEGCVTLEIFSNHRASHTTYVEGPSGELRSEEHTSELQSLMRKSYAVFCVKKKNIQKTKNKR